MASDIVLFLGLGNKMFFKIDKFDCVPLFSSPISLTGIEENLDELHSVKNDKFLTTHVESSFNSYKTKDNRILEKFPKEKEIILQKFYEFKNSVLKTSTDFVISTSWATMIKNKGYSQYHNHKNSFYSGVLYLEDVQNGGHIQFKNPMTEFGGFLTNIKEWGIFNYEIFHVQPKKNLLILFPSYLSHKINLYSGETPRYSLAFNFVPVGIFGEGDSSVNYKFVE
jgi:uncharacterized protein (TIGR02466 family)